MKFTEDVFTKEFVASERETINNIRNHKKTNAVEHFVTTRYAESLDEVERLQAQLEVERPTGICEICTSTVIKENARLRGEKERLSVTMKLIKDRGLKHGVEWCVATASGALESEGG